ncbi:YbhB/YbcL family Raf kinase inhibitor-like protein [Aquabacterium sp. A7-Y]|uniref:YbhB/YbcL family Raf kinase inhibitor-like protein n=1 Tax=Aquabacterium sp. A7-Y TaxID=1349605 RepID=UPI00223D465D|nr:YbhB/YbcL family Raf kinase inhibitor-like protein [Aquabacterium sp. A7-Y]MCW7539858.1 YbhB/YbcL family Raf kinase inhibitor-like protein [Aquabacterium sp. A7-Y]
MKLVSNSWPNGGRIPQRYAAGRPDEHGGVTFADNVNPQLAWDAAPEGTRSFVLICHDPDVPSRGDDVNQPDREVPESLPRVDFFHWVLVDLPATLREIAEGEFSRGFTPRGKPGPASLHGSRQGLNDYTGWFEGDPQNGGQYFGYDGPFPPFNDARVHRYVFTLHALDLPHCPVDGSFTGSQVREAIRGHVLGQASFSGTYTLNRRLL